MITSSLFLLSPLIFSGKFPYLVKDVGISHFYSSVFGKNEIEKLSISL